MRKERILNRTIAVLLIVIVAVEIGLALKIRQIDADTERVETVMEATRERIDRYYASLPARERQIVISVAPEVIEMAEERHR